ncbi:MAG: hypothetical protein RMA76_44070 [Deltaproteobacteria bacterium]|jgi:uncharacterized membrane protein YraQ (UPF0718 family)
MSRNRYRSFTIAASAGLLLSACSRGTPEPSATVPVGIVEDVLTKEEQ